MILKGSQRGGAKQLAQHLMRIDDNEHVEVFEIRGFMSADLRGALNEAYAVSRGTKSKQFLFSLSLNPPQLESVDIETFLDAVERIEAKLGLTGQPRAIVFHEKEGRRHAHCVWSRIDADTMTARNLPYFKLKLRDISRQLFFEHEWKMPRGLMNSEERDPRNFSLAEWQQAKRMGWHAGDLKAVMQECWAVSDSRAAFAQALSERGMILARGDRRGHVAVTVEGEVLSIARYVGKRAREVRAKLGDPGELPGVEEAKALFAQDMAAAFKRHAAEVRDHKSRRMAALDRQRETMTTRHRAERAQLDRGQRERWKQEARARSARLNSGLRGLWQRLIGQQRQIQRENEREAYDALQRDQAQRQLLIDAQLQERQALQREIKRIRSLYAKTLLDVRGDRRRFNALARSGEAHEHADESKPTPTRQDARPQRRRRRLQTGPEPESAKRGTKDRSGGRKGSGSRDRGWEPEP